MTLFWNFDINDIDTSYITADPLKHKFPVTLLHSFSSHTKNASIKCHNQINDHMLSKVWDNINYPFPNLNYCTDGNGEVIRPSLYNGGIYLFMLGLKLIHVSKRTTGV